MPAEDPHNQQQPAESKPPVPVYLPGIRYEGLHTHELWQLLDDMEDERARARRREAFYISTIVYLLVAWFIFYGPQMLWHQPRMINPADVLKDKDLTYLDLPPDAMKEMKPRTPPKVLSDKDRVQQTPDKRTLQKLRAEEPPSPPPATPQAQQQAELPSAPQPQTRQQQEPPLAEAPRPQAQKPQFAEPSTTDNMRSLAENAMPTHPGLSGNYGGAGVPNHGGLQAPVEVLSDTTGADIDPYIRHLLADLKAHWLPLIPEEAYPPLSKHGETLIRFTISPDGHILAMQLDGSTKDTALDRAAWGSITSVGQFQALPKGMKDPNLTLRIRFMVNETDE